MRDATMTFVTRCLLAACCAAIAVWLTFVSDRERRAGQRDESWALTLAAGAMLLAAWAVAP